MLVSPNLVATAAEAGSADSPFAGNDDDQDDQELNKGCIERRRHMSVHVHVYIAAITTQSSYATQPGERKEQPDCRKAAELHWEKYTNVTRDRLVMPPCTS